MGNCWGAPLESQRTSNTIPASSLVTQKNNDDEMITSSDEGVVLIDGLVNALRNFIADEMVFGIDQQHDQGDLGINFKGCISEKAYNNLSDYHQSSSSLKSTLIDSINNSDGCRKITIKLLIRKTLPKEWQFEVKFLKSLSHPNLVKLLGYYMENGELFLIYEFIQKGSLENHLFHRESVVLTDEKNEVGSTVQQHLSWGTRLKVAKGAAQGLAYLHNSEKKIIYGEFKASNILLDENFNAKLSDFGLAYNGFLADPLEAIRTMKIYGYGCKSLDPEYDDKKGDLKVESDVYGFGVVLLEMLTGRRAFDTSRPIQQHDFFVWLKPSLADPTKLRQIMDLRLQGQYHEQGAIQAAQLVLKCLEPDPIRRPSMNMNEIVEALEKIEALNESHEQDIKIFKINDLSY